MIDSQFRKFLFPALLSRITLCLVLAGAGEGPVCAQAPAIDLASYVNPFVGTDRDGDTYPGAQAPFGMVQFNPDVEGQGYYYSKLTMHGFALTLMSGPGGANGGTPFFTATTGSVQVDQAHYSYTYDHKNESASAGYYRVLMQPSGINAELTATTRCGMARFTFPAGQQANVLLPISYANVTTFASKVDKIDDHTLTGQTSTKPFYGPAKPIVIYFAMVFDQPFTQHGKWIQDQVTANSNHVEQTDKTAKVGFYVSYPASTAPRVLNVRIGISYVSVAGAMNNLKTEMPEVKFDDYHAQTVSAWNRELSLIGVEGGTELHKRIFYTALYHALLFPSIFDDADGRYMGFDDAVHPIPKGHRHIYANYSGWDIYRTEWPLLTLIEPDRAQDMAQSIVEMYKQVGYIDRWPEANRPSAIMNGNPLTICLVNIWNAGLRNFDVDKAYEAMLKASVPTSTNAHLGMYEPIEDHGGTWLNADSNVSTAQEYDLSFAALGHMALHLNKPDDANFLLGRALEYQTLFNRETGFFQPRDARGEWESPDLTSRYCEGDKWIYLWFVPEDVQGLVNLLGGSGAFEKKLDQFFGEDHYDATNEPDLQAPFLYDYINRPWKTEKLVAETSDKVFTDAPGGLANGGNDDLGEMSAWYIMSQLGFYPVDPGVPYFETCTPRFPKATLHLGAGADAKVFTIETPAASPENIYIQSATLNGSPLTKPWFDEKEILSGGELKVAVGPQPNPDWGASPFDRPYSLSTGLHYVPPDAVPVPLVPPAGGSPLVWRYTTTKPGPDWMQPNFPDNDWKEGPGGFGTDTATVKARTPWTSEDIWMRTTFDLKKMPARPALSVNHDNGIAVYLNGVLAVQDGQSVDQYTIVKILAPAPDATPLLHVGQNVIALHVHHSADDQEDLRHFADAVLLEETIPDDKQAR
jgi:predicted alpha-1,2-mannosidase